MSDFWSDNSEVDLFGPSTRRVYSVTEVMREVKRTLEGAFFSVLVEGEISNFTRHRSGHLYFSVKDQDAQISCVMWRGRGRNMHFRPADGMRVRITGNITVYERQGRMQLDVQHLMPVGEGELQLAFEALKRQLDAEGLFDASHKQPLPLYPMTIGVVTSPTGAAIRDIQSVIQRRFSGVRLILKPVRVQGDAAAAEIVAAIEAFNAHGEADLLIVGRGGGSLEDLWAFNESIVAHAIYQSEIPVISAVGHEIDFTISDFVADMRAPTPSAAAEMAVQDGEMLHATLSNVQTQLIRLMGQRLEKSQLALDHLRDSYGLRWPGDRIREFSLRLDEQSRLLEGAFRQSVEKKGLKVSALEKALEALNPRQVLQRGFSITTGEDGAVIRNAAALHRGQRILTQLANGSVESQVDKIEQD